MCSTILLATTSVAAPTDDIRAALAAAGTTDIAHVSTGHFLRAFNAIALRVPPRDLPDYVVAAISIRPALSGGIVGVALTAALRHSESRQSSVQKVIDRIVRAAINANPAAVVAIAQGGVRAVPTWRASIVASAISAAPEKEAIIQNATQSRRIVYGFLGLSEKEDAGWMFSAGSLNPANIANNGDDAVNSPEQPPTP